jgi:transposase
MIYDIPINEIETLRRYQHNAGVKVTGILMPAKGYSPEAVSECLGIDTSTVYRYWHSYKEGRKHDL